MLPARASSSPWALASRGCLVPTPNSLGGLGLGLLPLPCQAGSMGRLPSQLLPQPVPSTHPAPLLLLPSLGSPPQVDLGRLVGKCRFQGGGEGPVAEPAEDSPCSGQSKVPSAQPWGHHLPPCSCPPELPPGAGGVPSPGLEGKPKASAPCPQRAQQHLRAVLGCPRAAALGAQQCWHARAPAHSWHCLPPAVYRAQTPAAAAALLGELRNQQDCGGHCRAPGLCHLSHCPVVELSGWLCPGGLVAGQALGCTGHIWQEGSSGESLAAGCVRHSGTASGQHGKGDWGGGGEVLWGCCRPGCGCEHRAHPGHTRGAPGGEQQCWCSLAPSLRGSQKAGGVLPACWGRDRWHPGAAAGIRVLPSRAEL